MVSVTMLTQMPGLACSWTSEAQEVGTNVGSDQCSLPKHLSVCPDQYRMAKTMVEEAVKLHKIFFIQGSFPVIRAALRERGWVERLLPETNLLHNKRSKIACDDIHQLMSIIAQKERPYFFWTARANSINTQSLLPNQIFNHWSSSRFISTKVGLCSGLRKLQWFDEADPLTFFPRCYNVGVAEEMKDFIADFRRTACTSLLQYVVERNVNDCEQRDQAYLTGDKEGCTPKTLPTVTSRTIDTALKVCQEYLDSVEHKDTDKSWDSSSKLSRRQWDKFLQDYYLAVHGGAEIQQSAYYVDRCQAMLKRLGEVCPQLGIDGTQNIWIIKPAAQACGRGIECKKQLHEILSLVMDHPTTMRASRRLVQKYIERPFLIHGTKGDVRQWFLVSDWKNLTVWWYNKCYIRFSTQPYSLDNLDRSVHLCNYSIQRYLQPSSARHPEIPKDNMWCCHQFRDFLASQGKSGMWESVVLPQMKKAIICALKTTLGQEPSRHESFHLFGADFMLDENLHAWLIEINSSPSLEPNTALKQKLGAAVQEDTLRVVLDTKTDPAAHTGGFQLIYEQAAVEKVNPVKFCNKGVGMNTRCHDFDIPVNQPMPRQNISWPVAPRHRLLSKEDETKVTAKVPRLLPKSGSRMVAQDVQYKPRFQRRLVPAASTAIRSPQVTQLTGDLRQQKQSKPAAFTPRPPPQKKQTKPAAFMPRSPPQRQHSKSAAFMPRPPPNSFMKTTGQERNLGNRKPASHRRTFLAAFSRPQASNSADKRPLPLHQLTPLPQGSFSPGTDLRQRFLPPRTTHKGNQHPKNYTSTIRFPRPVREPTLPLLWDKKPLHHY